MSQLNWQKFLSDNKACTPGFGWAQNQSGIEAAWASCPDGHWLLWFAFTEAGNDLTKRRALIKELKSMVIASEALILDEDLMPAFSTLKTALELWVDHPDQDPSGLGLANAVTASDAVVRQLIRDSLETNPFADDPQFMVASALVHLAKAALADNGASSCVCAQHCLGAMLVVMLRTNQVPAPAGGAQQAQKGATMVRTALANYTSTKVAEIAQARGI